MTMRMEQVVWNGDDAANIIATPNLAPETGDLVIAHLITRAEGGTHSISGLGLTWTQIAQFDQPSTTTAGFRMSVWRAVAGSTPSPGPVTGERTGGAGTNTIVLQVLRISGADATTPIEASVVAEGPTTANKNLKVSITTVTANAWALAIASHRGTPLTLDPGVTVVGRVVQNVSAAATSSAIWYREIGTPGLVTLGDDNNLANNQVWSIVALSIAPDPTQTILLAGIDEGYSEDAGSLEDIPQPVPTVRRPILRTYSHRLLPSVYAFQPLVEGNSLLYDLTGVQSSYTHNTRAMGGFWSASIRLNDSLVDLEEWFESGLGRRIVTTSPDGEVVWEGFVNAMRLSWGGLTKIKGNLLDAPNMVKLWYSLILPGSSQDEIGFRIPTDWVENLAAQQKYGIIQRVLSGSGMTQETAESLVVDYLNEFSEPQIDQDWSGAEPALELDCAGYVRWTEAYVYDFSSSSAGAVNLSQKLIDVLAEEPNGFISTDTRFIATNTLQEAAKEADDRTAWDIIKTLIAKGDAADVRHLFGVYADRMAYYGPVADEVTYQQRLTDPAGRFTTPAGAVVQPWDIKPGKWLFAPDILVGRVPDDTALRDDPRATFLEEVTYRAPYTVELRGSRTRRIDQRLARLGLAGIGG